MGEIVLTPRLIVIVANVLIWGAFAAYCAFFRWQMPGWIETWGLPAVAAALITAMVIIAGITNWIEIVVERRRGR